LFLAASLSLPSHKIRHAYPKLHMNSCSHGAHNCTIALVMRMRNR